MTGNAAERLGPQHPGRGRTAAWPRGDNPGLKGCPEPLSEHYDAALLDLDGVVYLGGIPIPGAADALSAAAKRGMKLAYVTNNASRSPNAIAAQLTGMGVAATAADIVTSAQAAAHVLAGQAASWRTGPGGRRDGPAPRAVGTAGCGRSPRQLTGRWPWCRATRPRSATGCWPRPRLALNAGALYVASNADATSADTARSAAG